MHFTKLTSCRLRSQQRKRGNKWRYRKNPAFQLLFTYRDTLAKLKTPAEKYLLQITGSGPFCLTEFDPAAHNLRPGF